MISNIVLKNQILELFILYIILYFDLLLMQGKGRHIKDSPLMYISTLYLFFERHQSSIGGKKLLILRLKHVIKV